jgi:hypothetical protein
MHTIRINWGIVFDVQGHSLEIVASYNLRGTGKQRTLGRKRIGMGIFAITISRVAFPRFSWIRDSSLAEVLQKVLQSLLATG